MPLGSPPARAKAQRNFATKTAPHTRAWLLPPLLPFRLSRAPELTRSRWSSASRASSSCSPRLRPCRRSTKLRAKTKRAGTKAWARKGAAFQVFPFLVAARVASLSRSLVGFSRHLLLQQRLVVLYLTSQIQMVNTRRIQPLRPHTTRVGRNFFSEE